MGADVHLLPIHSILDVLKAFDAEVAYRGGQRQVPRLARFTLKPGVPWLGVSECPRIGLRNKLQISFPSGGLWSRFHPALSLSMEDGSERKHRKVCSLKKTFIMPRGVRVASCKASHLYNSGIYIYNINL